jgi:histidinol-phosphate aminotransferase
MPRLTDLVESLPASVPFVGPEAQERARGRPFVARLGANESPFGPSPRVVEAMARAAADTWMYGDPENHDLKAALAAAHGVTPAHLVVGEGIDALLGYLVRMCVGPGDAVVTSDGAYPTFNFHVAGYGGVLARVPYRDDREDVPALVARAAEVGARLIYLANPDNPMGTWHPAATLEAAIGAVPEGCLLVLDEAYVEFAPDDAVPRIDAEDPRVVRLRTFSKAYGMAGARVGYGIGAPALMRSFDKIRNHFGMSRVSQAGALAALGDPGWIGTVRREVAVARERISEIGRAHGLLPLPSATNFVTLDCRRDGTFARSVLRGLIDRDVFVRMPFVAPGDRCIRVSAGPARDLDAFAAALPRALDAAAG